MSTAVALTVEAQMFPEGDPVRPSPAPIITPSPSFFPSGNRHPTPGYGSCRCKLHSQRFPGRRDLSRWNDPPARDNLYQDLAYQQHGHVYLGIQAGN